MDKASTCTLYSCALELYNTRIERGNQVSYTCIYGFWCNSRVNSRAYPLVPGSVAEMSEPNRREGMMDSLKPSGIAVPVTLAALEPTVSKLVRV